MISWKEFKKGCKHLIFIMFDKNCIFRWTIFKLSLDCLLWEIRGLQRCPHHGHHAQNLWNGFCKECGEIPKLPSMADICILCGEEKAVLQRASPNYDDKDIWSLCWECNEYIDWGLELSWCQQAEDMGLKGEMVKPFNEWLFDKHQVYPKHKSIAYILKKK